ncbi:MAG TPA: hypothetical protein VMT20_06980 [Terriglobia bacterium]|nr:hypothetical protein [Terriglobia bacterium]
MSELDDLYVRTRLLWEQDPEKFERDQPLLARAFSAQQVDQAPARAVFDAHLRKLEGDLKAAQGALEDAHLAIKVREGQLQQEIERLRRSEAVLADRVAQQEQTIEDLQREPLVAPDEAERLAGLGWRKGA